MIALFLALAPVVTSYTMHPQPKGHSTVTRWPRGLVIFAPPPNGGTEAKFRGPCKNGWHEKSRDELWCVPDRKR